MNAHTKPRLLPLVALALLTITVLGAIQVKPAAAQSGTEPGGELKIWDLNPPLARFILNNAPYGTPPSPCTTAGPTQQNTYRIVTIPDLGTGEDIQPITKVVFKAARENNAYIRWLPDPASSSYNKDFTDPKPVFPNVTYIPGGQFSVRNPLTNQLETRVRPDQLVYEGGVMDHGGSFRLGFDVERGNPGTIFDVQVELYFANGLDGWRTNGTAYGKLIDNSVGPNSTTRHSQTDDVNCGVGGARNLEIRIDSRPPELMRVNQTANTYGAAAYDADSNGHLDHLQLIFNEPLDVSSLGLNSFDITRRIGSDTRVYKVLSIAWEPNPWSGLQMHDTVNLTLQEIPQYDTGDMPDIALKPDSPLRDPAGNVRTNLRYRNNDVIDRAGPVLMSAYAYVGARELVLRFSEGVYGSGDYNDPGCTAPPAGGSWRRGQVMKCNLVYEDGKKGTTASTSVHNCVRSATGALTEFEESPSAPGSSTVIFPLRQGPDEVGTKTGFCDLDVNFTAGFFDSIKPSAGVFNNQYPFGPDGVPDPADDPDPDDDPRQLAGTIYDFKGNQLVAGHTRAGNRAFSPPDCLGPWTSQGQAAEIVRVSGAPVHDNDGEKGGNNYPHVCQNAAGRAVPVTPPRINWVEVDNDNTHVVLHFSGPVANITQGLDNFALPIVAFDVVSSTGGAPGGIKAIQHAPGTDKAYLTLDRPINPTDVSNDPSKVRVRCDPEHGSPWSFILGTGLPGSKLGVHSNNLMQDGRTVPAHVTVPCGDYPMLDRTPPRILWANTTDLNHDGFIDGYQLVFSEPVDDSSFCGGFNPSVASCPAETFSGILKLVGPPTPRAEVELNRGIDPLTNFTYHTGEKDNDRVGFVKFPQDFPAGRSNRLYTDAVPDIVTTATGHLFSDLIDPLRGGNQMEPIGTFDVVEGDGAGPFPLKAETLDQIDLLDENVWNTGIQGDGYIEAYRVTFTERVRESSFTPCEWVVAGHNVTTSADFAVGDNDATRPAYILRGDYELIVLYESHALTDVDGDTDAKPELTYKLGGATCPAGVSPSGFKDVFNNPMQTIVEADIEEGDTAAPVLLRVIAYGGEEQAIAVFSEPVDNGRGEHLVWRDFMYGNVNKASVSGQAPGRDANQNTREAIDASIQTGTPPGDPIPGTQFVLLPLNAKLTGPGSGADIGSDLLNVDLRKARETAPSVPPAQRQWVPPVPQVVGQAPDITPPGAIKDLGVSGSNVGPTGYLGSCTGSSAGDVKANSVRLQWRAPGDDGYTGGSVSRFDLRFSTKDITAENFHEANTTAPDPPVSAPDTIVSAEILDLKPVTTYYFAVRAIDDAGNVGPLSNSCSALTTQDTTPPRGAGPAPVITSPTHDEGVATTESRAEFEWTEFKDGESTVLYRYAINTNKDYQVLSTDTQTTGREAVYPELLDGEWWFHVAAYSGGGASGTGHYKIVIGPNPISEDEVLEANELITVDPKRVNGVNEVAWTLPDDDDLPGELEAIEIWRLDRGVPSRVHTEDGTYAELRHGTWNDTTPGATEDSQYRVDMVFAGGYRQAQSVDGFKAVEGSGASAAMEYLIPLLLVALAILVAGVVIFVVLRRRQKQAVKESAVPYKWTATGEVVLDPVTGLPIHDVKCPNCAVDFQAQGELPLQITCPSCNVSGVLN